MKMIDNSTTPWDSLLKQKTDENNFGTVEKLDSSAEADFDIRWTLDSSNRCGIKIYLKSISLELIENASWDNHREISIDFSLL